MCVHIIEGGRDEFYKFALLNSERGKNIFDQMPIINIHAYGVVLKLLGIVNRDEN